MKRDSHFSQEGFSILSAELGPSSDLQALEGFRTREARLCVHSGECEFVILRSKVILLLSGQAS